MSAPLLYALQVYDGDITDALAVARLHEKICEFNGHRYSNTDCILVYRRDCPPDRVMERILSECFRSFSVLRGSRRETGFPAGPNGLWCDLMQNIAQLYASKKLDCECVLTTEADAVPLVVDWDQKLLEAWRRENAKVCGHWLPNGDFACGHINGNALFDPSIAKLSPKFVGCDSAKAWDSWFAPDFKALGWADTPEIRSIYRKARISPELMETLRSKGCVWLHGIKGDSAVLGMRRYLDSL
jgi:hypothetical protein